MALYLLLNPNGNKVTGVIDALKGCDFIALSTALDLGNQLEANATLAKFLPDILEITTQRGHTLPARMHHGIQHVTRAASYVSVLANLYRRYGDEEALSLTDDDVKLIQIAVLFHDAARLDEGTDIWDTASAGLLYHYLTQVLGLEDGKALLLADAVAKKDDKAPKNIYQKIIHDADCLDIIRARPHFEANYLDFYQYIVMKTGKENCQAFEEMAQLIVEVRSIIDAQGDGYDRIQLGKKAPFESTAAYQRIQNTLIKDEKDRKCLSNLDPLDPRDHYQIFPKLSKLLPKERLQDPLLDAEATLPFTLFRTVTDPSAIRKKVKKKQMFGQISEEKPSVKEKKQLRPETMAHVEIRKALRKPGVDSGTSKSDGLSKDGNPFRSVSSRFTFGDCGFFDIDYDLYLVAELPEEGKKLRTNTLYCAMTKNKDGKPILEYLVLDISGKKSKGIIETLGEGCDFSAILSDTQLEQRRPIAQATLQRHLPAILDITAKAGHTSIGISLDDLSAIALIDSDTGRFKKKNLTASTAEAKKQSNQQKRKELQSSQRTLKMGGESTSFSGKVSQHDEIIYHVRASSLKGIFYTHDPNLYNVDTLGTYYPSHHFAPPLKAIFLQKQYKIQTKDSKEGSTGKHLPIREYSAVHNYFVEKKFTEDDIIIMWTQMCSDYIKQQLQENEDASVYPYDIEMLKINSMYLCVASKYNQKNAAADSNYDIGLKQKINDAITKECKKIFLAHQEKITQYLLITPDISWTQKPIFDYLMVYPVLLTNEDINKKLNAFLQRSITDINISIYHEEKLDLVYKLSLKIGNQKISEAIQKKMLSLMLEIIKSQHKLSNYFIEKTTKYFAAFGLADQICLAFRKKLSDFFDSTLGDKRDNFRIISSASKLGMLNESLVNKFIQNHLLKYVDYFENQYDVVSHDEIDKFLEILACLKIVTKEDIISVDGQKFLVELYFSKIEICALNDRIPITILKICMDHRDLFTSLINGIRFDTYKLNWFNYLDHVFGDQEVAFSDWQIKIIHEAQAEMLVREIEKIGLDNKNFQIITNENHRFILCHKKVFEALAKWISNYSATH